MGLLDARTGGCAAPAGTARLGPPDPRRPPARGDRRARGDRPGHARRSGARRAAVRHPRAHPGTSRRRTHRHRPVRRHHRRIHHPVQIARPRTASSVDADAAQAVRSRRALPAAPVRHRRPRPCAPTCPPPTAGTVASKACPYDLVPAPAHTPNHPTHQDTSPDPVGQVGGARPALRPTTGQEGALLRRAPTARQGRAGQGPAGRSGAGGQVMTAPTRCGCRHPTTGVVSECE